jgi:carbonic anhydrase/acetyltransferase-like protein (isoleucine patch superfamily)
VVGDGATVGHGAIFESCVIGARALIGMNAVLLHGSVIGEEALVAALSVVPEGMSVPARSLVAGAPATVRKELTGSAAEWVRDSGAHYVALARQYLEQGIGRVDG